MRPDRRHLHPRTIGLCAFLPSVAHAEKLGGVPAAVCCTLRKRVLNDRSVTCAESLEIGESQLRRVADDVCVDKEEGAAAVCSLALNIASRHNFFSKLSLR